MKKRTEIRGDSLSSRIIIMGAAGRDFHNFNTVFRDDALRAF